MKKHPILFLILGIFILVVPTFIYLCFLVPQLSSEYNTLMTSGGVIGGFGLYGSSKVPDKVKYGGLFKTATNTFTILTVIMLVEKFIMKLVWLVALFTVCFIVFKILEGMWKNGKQRIRDEKLATKIARNIDENFK